MKIAHIRFTEVFKYFYIDQSGNLQTSIDCCLEWILSAPFFPPEGLTYTHSPPFTYHIRVPYEWASLWLTTDILSPGILQLTDGHLGSLPQA